jgi:hypothetical protein
MKGIGKPKGLKQTFAERLMSMIGKGNKEHKEKVKKVLKNMQLPDQPVSKRHVSRAYFTKSMFHKATPNPMRRNTKTLNGEIKHQGHIRGLGTKAPTLDQTRALEQRIGLKVQVRNGKCYAGGSGFEIPINATLDEALDCAAT